MYKEVQVMPTMFSLDTSKVVWTSVPSANNFWEYTPELEALYSSDFDGYVLPAGGSVVWLKSRLDSAFRLDRNEVAR
ncbi:MAG: hypothetical protein LBF15_02420 [Candidatus Peribacteria bacterium]|jgi:hypothetical protein|nr:hypothetical protein [Candidatus Peribacteria bacterium]